MNDIAADVVAHWKSGADTLRIARLSGVEEHLVVATLHRWREQGRPEIVKERKMQPDEQAISRKKYYLKLKRNGVQGEALQKAMNSLPMASTPESACAELRVRVTPTEYSTISRAAKAAGTSIPDYTRAVMDARVRSVTDADIVAWILNGLSWDDIQKRSRISRMDLAVATGRVADELMRKLREIEQ